MFVFAVVLLVLFVWVQVQGMPTQAEIRAKALELKAKGADAVSGPSAAKRPIPAGYGSSGSASGAAGARGDSSSFERLLRYSLYEANSKDSLLCGANIVFVVVADRLQNTLEEAARLWDGAKPEQPGAKEGRWVPHPLGERRAYLFGAMMQDGVGALGWAKQPEVKAALDYFDNMPDQDSRLSVGDVAPRHKTPKPGRPWVWELTVGTLAPEEFKAHLRAIMGYLASHPDATTIKIEPHRKGQTGLRKALWDDLKAMQEPRP
eukprot:TRINITY_DN9032_c0_g1_i1.p1 TRINITY_DN9032_c0_g1~~TRINITY_DN9032_c0_g1_i1.p1  ORF type:complete len:262 (-),score=36.54 TRINITY_DN9032_c0_g1_i1:601-1386(-)